MKNYKIKKSTVPLIPLRGIAIFPNVHLHFDVGREKSINALEEAMLEDSYVFLTVQKDAEVENPEIKDFYDVGVVCKIKQMLKLPGENIRILAEGLHRGKILEVSKKSPYFEAEIEEYVYEIPSDEVDADNEAVKRACLNQFEEFGKINPRITAEAINTIKSIDNPDKFSDVILTYLKSTIEFKQGLLADFDPYSRMIKLTAAFAKEAEIIKMEEQIEARVKSSVSEMQRDVYLKEQLKAIRKELGEEEENPDDYVEKVSSSKLPKEVKEKVLKDARKLQKISSASPDAGVLKTYLDYVLDLPWKKKKKDEINIKNARMILDEDHYGLEDVKERILEFLAVRKLNPKTKGSILCLVGPPGVGKTSIAKSIARACNRSFARISLGGVRDEAQIRGHRRTYVGAMPGSIIDSIAKSKSSNPVFLLDEIDKLANDFRGDPASALLEVLDPEQNSTFTDHYLDIPFDLSQIMFVTTANTMSTIPAPLLDRMEIITLSGYTDEEKLNIASKYLLKKQLKENGLDAKKVKIGKNVLYDIVEYYTRESGVRKLEQNIGKVIRKAAVAVVEDGKKSVSITRKNLEKYLGPKRFLFESIFDEDQIGVVTGLAWTSVGGETLFVEVNVMEGTGKLQLTGQMGDVMKESAMAAYSYLKSNMDLYDIDRDKIKTSDLHIHIPEGAIPKDGPSAGVTMATAMYSALTGKHVRRDIAMTGEITIRGRVLPIGGLKEKLLAARRAGINKVIVPEKNKADVDKISSKIISELEIVYAKTIDDVYKHAITD